jgi:hypothetical protein
MPGSNSNLSTVDGQHAAAAAATASKRKEDDAAAAHQEQDALVAAVPAARKTMDETQVHERAAALAWKKEKIIARHLEQQLAIAQGIVIP